MLCNMAAKDVSKTKSAALEILLFEAKETRLDRAPSSISATAPKHKDGKARLLLTQDTLAHVLYSDTLDQVRVVPRGNPM